MKRIYRVVVVLVSLATLFGIANTSFAVPYASGLHSIGNDTYQFILNESADNVTILRDGGNVLDLGALSAGRHSFSMAGFNSLEIKVSKSAATGWTAISDLSNLFTHIEHPVGLAVNSDPSSPYFGTVYTANARAQLTVSGRNMAMGIYALTADMIGVDLANNFAVVTDANDTSYFKNPGWSTNSSTASPWRISLDGGGNLIIADFSDDFGGIKYASPDLTSGGLVLATEGGPNGGVFSSVSDEFGLIPLHGSITSKPIVTGTLFQDLTVWAIDEDLDRDLAHPGNDGNSVWRWDVGNQTNYDINPTLVINGGDIQLTTDNRLNWIVEPRFVFANAHYDVERNKWYLAQNRADGNQAGLIVLTPGENGSSTLEWSSLDFTIENGLDGHSTLVGIQDVFRHMGGGMTVSEDGTKLFVHRVNHSAVNPVLGTTSNLPGTVLIIPLDENGIPDLQVENGIITNMDSITTANNAANATRRELAIDAAGNVYTGSNSSERLQVFSPGGNTLAITGFDLTTMLGTFELLPLADGFDGDHNKDGFVNAADYALWRDQISGDEGGYTAWRNNFGASAGSGAGAVVPEPSSFALLGFALLGLLGIARRS